jgi:hypothetical protein
MLSKEPEIGQDAKGRSFILPIVSVESKNGDFCRAYSLPVLAIKRQSTARYCNIEISPLECYHGRQLMALMDMLR